MPESVRNRPSNVTEEIFLFSKTPDYYYDNQAVREETGANLRNYWLLGPDTSGTPHPAVFPKELARRPEDLVLDPFSGSGTTGLAAVELNRRAVLVELNEEYAAHSKTRVDGVQLTLSIQQPVSRGCHMKTLAVPQATSRADA